MVQRQPLLGLLESLDDVISELRFDWLRNLALIEFEGSFLEFLNHLAASEFAEISAFFP